MRTLSPRAVLSGALKIADKFTVAMEAIGNTSGIHAARHAVDADLPAEQAAGAAGSPRSFEPSAGR
jgi:hypothetical protein